MNTIESNLTASGHSLREVLQQFTGYDPVAESDFRWSNHAACWECGVADSTAVMSLDDTLYRRLCFHCAVEWMEA